MTDQTEAAHSPDLRKFRLTRQTTAEMRNALVSAIAVEDKDRANLDYLTVILAHALAAPGPFTITIYAEED